MNQNGCPGWPHCYFVVVVILLRILTTSVPRERQANVQQLRLSLPLPSHAPSDTRETINNWPRTPWQSVSLGHLISWVSLPVGQFVEVSSLASHSVQSPPWLGASDTQSEKSYWSTYCTRPRRCLPGVKLNKLRWGRWKPLRSPSPN